MDGYEFWIGKDAQVVIVAYLEHTIPECLEEPIKAKVLGSGCLASRRRIGTITSQLRSANH
jgi:hypothetical protein